jgi:hypothetical protein
VVRTTLRGVSSFFKSDAIRRPIGKSACIPTQKKSDEHESSSDNVNKIVHLFIEVSSIKTLNERFSGASPDQGPARARDHEGHGAAKPANRPDYQCKGDTIRSSSERNSNREPGWGVANLIACMRLGATFGYGRKNAPIAAKSTQLSRQIPFKDRREFLISGQRGCR